MPYFDSKLFNGEVFQKYVDNVPNTKLNELLKSRAVVARPDLKAAMDDQVGGNYITTPLLGLIKGSTPVNYDGQTNITSQSTRTFSHSRVVVGRAQSWVEKDFSYDITGGVDFMENVAKQVAEYWDDVDQDTLIAILDGVFSMSDTAGAAFVASHTYDITSVVNTEGDTGKMDATTLNTAMQKACGDNKGKFSLAIMHSAVATHLENMNLLTYLKYNDENGMQRDTSMATLNGRLVLVDDSMPVDTTGASPVYTTYIFGDGAIEYTNCGAKVPSEMARDAKTNGGQDTLYSRQRKCFAPYGISFTQANMTSLSPTNTELRDGDNWMLVNSGGVTPAEYIDTKAIPIAKITSLA